MSLVIRRAVIEPRYYCTKRKKQLFHNLILSKMHLFLNFAANWVWGRTVEFLLWGFIYICVPTRGSSYPHIFFKIRTHGASLGTKIDNLKHVGKRNKLLALLAVTEYTGRGTVRNK
jgi:hypothetical protein